MQFKEIYNKEIFQNIMHLLHQEYGETYNEDRIKNEFQDLLDKKLILCCLINNQNIIGHISFKKPTNGNNVCSVVSVFINKEYRHKGFGKLMMLKFETYAKKLGFKQIMLGARRGRENFYFSCGYSGEVLVQYKKEYFNKEYLKNILIAKNVSTYKYLQDTFYHKFYFDAKNANMLYPVVDKSDDKMELVVIFIKNIV